MNAHPHPRPAHSPANMLRPWPPSLSHTSRLFTLISLSTPPQARVEDALRRIGANNLEAAMEWLIMHPEAEPAAAAAVPGAVAGAPAAAAAGENPMDQ